MTAPGRLHVLQGGRGATGSTPCSTCAHQRPGISSGANFKICGALAQYCSIVRSERNLADYCPHWSLRPPPPAPGWLLRFLRWIW